MDTKTLVDALRAMFAYARQRQIIVDAFALAPAYRGMVKDAYVLGISAPSLVNKECYDKIDLFIDMMHERISAEERRSIDRIRVYDSHKELEEHARCGFDEDYCDICERPLQFRPEMVELEPA